MNKDFDSEIKLKLLKLLKDEPALTQREMNQKMGVSLGKINYCISALADKGMIRVERFKKHKSKSAYMYRLTPNGFEEITTLTLRYLRTRLREYDQIKQEIKALSRELDYAELGREPDLLEDLKNIS